MPRLLQVHPLFFVFTVLLRSQPTPDACPVFTPDEGIARITPKDRIFRFEGGYVAVVNEVRLDTDGSPVAYHPLNKGTTNLCNGLDPIIDEKRISDKKAGSPCFAAVRAAIDAGWRRETSPGFCVYGFYAPGTNSKDLKCNAWGGTFGTGEIPRQGQDDPAPGFFVSITAARNPGRAPEDSQRRYLGPNALRGDPGRTRQEQVTSRIRPRLGLEPEVESLRGSGLRRHPEQVRRDLGRIRSEDRKGPDRSYNALGSHGRISDPVAVRKAKHGRGSADREPQRARGLGLLLAGTLGTPGILRFGHNRKRHCPVPATTRRLPSAVLPQAAAPVTRAYFSATGRTTRLFSAGPNRRRRHCG